MRHTAVTPSARLCATAAVTLAGLCEMPWATTPLSAQNTSARRGVSCTFSLPVSPAICSMACSRRPRLPKGLAQAFQCSLAFCAAAALGGVMPARRPLSVCSAVMVLAPSIGSPPGQSAGPAAACPQNTSAESPHTGFRSQSRSASFCRSRAFRHTAPCRYG